MKKTDPVLNLLNSIPAKTRISSKQEFSNRIGITIILSVCVYLFQPLYSISIPPDAYNPYYNNSENFDRSKVKISDLWEIMYYDNSKDSQLKQSDPEQPFSLQPNSDTTVHYNSTPLYITSALIGGGLAGIPMTTTGFPPEFLHPSPYFIPVVFAASILSGYVGERCYNHFKKKELKNLLNKKTN